MPRVHPDLPRPPLTGGFTDVSGSFTDVTGGFTDVDGLRCYRIGGFHHLSPFLVPVVGAHDVWLFLSSAGGLTAGRTRPDDALFPYVTEDKLADTAGATGGLTVIRTDGPDGREVCWEPLAPAGRADPRVSRSLSKDALSTTVIVEEVREDLGLRFREVWRTSGAFGVVRESGSPPSTGARTPSGSSTGCRTCWRRGWGSGRRVSSASSSTPTSGPGPTRARAWRRTGWVRS